jgi:hypothetical protein
MTFEDDLASWEQEIAEKMAADPEYAAAYRRMLTIERRARTKRYRMCGCVDIIARDGALLGGWGRVDCGHDPVQRAVRMAYRQRQLARRRRRRR